MFRLTMAALLGSMLVITAGGLTGQVKKEESKKDDTKKDDTKKDDTKTTKKEEPTKGKLPANWKKLGLSDEQLKDIYRIESKYNVEIDQMQTKVTELKKTRDKEMKGILTPDQKKRLEDIQTGKDKDK